MALASLSKALRAPKTDLAPEAARPHGSFRRKIAFAGVMVYTVGLLIAMLGSTFASGDWRVGLLTIPQALLAALFAGGAMGGALLCPDPYIAEDGEKPATLPDFD